MSPVKKTAKPAGKTAKKAAPKAAGMKRAAPRATKAQKVVPATRKKAAPPRVAPRADKSLAQKQAQVKKLQAELGQMRKQIDENRKALEWAQQTAEKEKDELREKTDQASQELKKKEAEGSKLKEELKEKDRALRAKTSEMAAYRKETEKRISELQAKEPTAGIPPAPQERQGLVTSKGNPVTLLGAEVQVGDKAPDFRVLDNGMKPVTLADFKGQLKVISSVGSLDTSVCNTETRRFNEEAEKLPEQVVILTISMDLPFAQARWCAAAGVEKVKTLSDYRERSFGLAYGLLVKESMLLARAVVIVDEQDVVRYFELVPEISQEPDYERVLNALRALLP